MERNLLMDDAEDGVRGRQRKRKPVPVASVDEEPKLHELEILTEDSEFLVWRDSPISYPQVVRMRTPSSVNGIYHALLNAVSIAYRQREIGGVELSSEKIVTAFRRELAQTLPAVYEQLAEGKILDMVHSDPSLSLVELQLQLVSLGHIPKVLLPFVANAIQCDLYFVSAHNRDVFPPLANMDLLIKRRRSIVLLYSRNHYELVGIINKRGVTDTIFTHAHPYIQLLYNRMS